MKIAIHAADLDHNRIDGTRVYMLNMLKNFGLFSPKDEFLIYHKGKFNPQLEPPKLANYRFFSLPFPIIWTQTRFPLALWKSKPQVLWMPVQNLPYFRRTSMKTVVTIHDLAFKYFPDFFPKKDLRKLNFLSDGAIRKSDKIIAVSKATKDDILKFYPEIKPEKIKVIHHGFDRELFQEEISKEESQEILSKYGLKNKNYLLYVGAIQPRKNLQVLVDAFEDIKAKYSDMKLVIAGAAAWNYNETLERIKNSNFADDIIVTGKIGFDELPSLYRGASIFVFPSLYEGFGIPVLEAMASGTPAILASNSSLPEVGGQAALYFDANSSEDLSDKILSLLSYEILAQELSEKGRKRAGEFSWEKCAKETLDFITEM